MEFLSAADVKDCMLKIHTLNYAEEACYNGTLVIKAFSSGMEIGSCNWILNSPKGDIAYVSGSSFISAHAMPFDYCSLQGTGALIYSDFFSLGDAQDSEDGDKYSVSAADKLQPMRYSMFHPDTSYGCSSFHPLAVVMNMYILTSMWFIIEVLKI